jgi:hypothetical protein
VRLTLCPLSAHRPSYSAANSSLIRQTSSIGFSFPIGFQSSAINSEGAQNRKSQIANRKSQIANRKSQIANRKSQIANRKLQTAKAQSDGVPGEADESDGIRRID